VWPTPQGSSAALAALAAAALRLTAVLERYVLAIGGKEAFSFALGRKLLTHYKGTPLHMGMRLVSDKIAESLVGDITLEPDWPSEHVGILPEERVRIDPFRTLNRKGCLLLRHGANHTMQTHLLNAS
jgi:hypothetical protein